MISLDYTHYSTISTVENNWGIPVGALGKGDNSTTQANVFSWVAEVTKHTNNNLTAPPLNETIAPVNGDTSGEPGDATIYDEPSIK